MVWKRSTRAVDARVEKFVDDHVILEGRVGFSVVCLGKLAGVLQVPCVVTSVNRGPYGDVPAGEPPVAHRSTHAPAGMGCR